MEESKTTWVVIRTVATLSLCTLFFFATARSFHVWELTYVDRGDWGLTFMAAIFAFLLSWFHELSLQALHAHVITKYGCFVLASLHFGMLFVIIGTLTMGASTHAGAWAIEMIAGAFCTAVIHLYQRQAAIIALIRSCPDSSEVVEE